MHRMQCPRCGAAGTGRFCSQCGAPMEEIIEAEEPDEELFRRVAEGLANSIQEEEYTRPMPVDEEPESMAEEPHEENRYAEQQNDRYEEPYDPRYEENAHGNRYEEDVYDDGYDDPYDDPYEEKKYERPSRRSDGGGVMGAAGNVMSTAGNAVGKGFHHMWDFICNFMRYASAVLMLLSAIYMGWIFLGSISSLGELRMALSSGEDAFRAYLLAALLCTAFAVLQIFWILKLGRRKVNGKKKPVDKGHGIFAFLLYTVAVMCAGLVVTAVPDEAGIYGALRMFFEAFRQMGNLFFMINALGLILSILRRLCGSL